jgi:predicted ribonuclease YlaK
MNRHGRKKRVDAIIKSLNLDEYLRKARKKLRAHTAYLGVFREKLEVLVLVDESKGLKDLLRKVVYRIGEATKVVDTRDLKKIEQQDIEVVFATVEIRDSFWKGSDGNEYMVKRNNGQIVYVRAILLYGEKEHERVQREQKQINELTRKYVADSKIIF